MAKIGWYILSICFFWIGVWVFLCVWMCCSLTKFCSKYHLHYAMLNLCVCVLVLNKSISWICKNFEFQIYMELSAKQQLYKALQIVKCPKFSQSTCIYYYLIVKWLCCKFNIQMYIFDILLWNHFTYSE